VEIQAGMGAHLVAAYKASCCRTPSTGLGREFWTLAPKTTKGTRENPISASEWLAAKPVPKTGAIAVERLSI